MSSARKVSLLRGLLDRVQRNRSKPRLADRSLVDGSLASKNDAAVSQVPMPSSLPQPPVDKDWHGTPSEKPAPPLPQINSKATGPEALPQQTAVNEQQASTPTSSDRAMAAYAAMAPVQSASPAASAQDEVTAGIGESAASSGGAEAELSSTTSPDVLAPSTDTSPTMLRGVVVTGEGDTDRILVGDTTAVEQQAHRSCRWKVMLTLQ